MTISMRRWARLLHVLAIAPAAVLMTVASAPLVAAQTAPRPAPQPYVICIDPGHGGVDPGALGVDGLVEKDLTLDIGQRLQRLLQADRLTVVMTRTDDSDVSIDSRSQTANTAGAALFVSIHLNAYSDAAVGGSLTLYPGAKDMQFARIMEERVAARLQPYAIGDGGSQLRDDWWIHVNAPAVTVESAYITNQQEGDLLNRPSFRDTLAGAIRDGIETYKPEILKRKQEILAAEPPVAATRHQSGGGGGNAAPEGGVFPAQLLRGALLVVAGALAVRYRRTVWWLLGMMGRGLTLAFRHSAVHRAAQRRRRRLVRERSVTQRSPRLGRAQSVYDELFL